MLHKLTKRPKFHDVACQGNLKFCQGIVREMSGNFVSSEVWQPCTRPRYQVSGYRTIGPLVFGTKGNSIAPAIDEESQNVELCASCGAIQFYINSKT